MTVNFAELKAGFRPRVKQVPVVVDGQLLAEYEAAVARMEQEAPTSLAGSAPAAAAVRDLETAIRAATVQFTVTGLGKNQYRRLVAAHTTKDDDRLDMDSFIPALLGACITEPAGVEIDWLMDHLGDGQIDDIFGAAFKACTESDGVPFSRLASVLTGG